MEFIKKHSSKIAITVGAAALLVGGYYLLTKNRKTTVVAELGSHSGAHSKKTTGLYSKPETMPNTSLVFVKDDRYHTMVERLKQVAQSEIATGELSKQTIIAINQTVIYLFKNDYVRLLLDGRKIRRKFMDNLDLYTSEFMKNSTEAEKLMENASLEVLRDLGIELEQYERSSERIMQSDPNFAMFNLYMFESVKMQVPSGRNKVLTKAELIQILNFQREQYKSVDFSHFIQNPEQAMLLKQTYVSDRASLEFDYEEEDIMKNPNVLQDPEVMDAQRHLQNAMLSEQANMGYMNN